MRRRLQLTLLAVALGAAGCRTDRAAPKPPACTEPGEPDPGRTVGEAVGRYQLDKEGCLFVDVSEDAGVRRTATEGFHAGVWRVELEQVVTPGRLVERADTDADGIFESVIVRRFGDGGWLDTVAETFGPDGGIDGRIRQARIDATRMRVVAERPAGDGGWDADDPFETSINQR